MPEQRLILFTISYCTVFSKQPDISTLLACLTFLFEILHVLSYCWRPSSLLPDMQSFASTSTTRWNPRRLHWSYPNKSLHPSIFSSSCSSSPSSCSAPHMVTAEHPLGVVTGKSQTWESVLFSAYRSPLHVLINIDWMRHIVIHHLQSRRHHPGAQLTSITGTCEVETQSYIKPIWLNLL